MKDLFKLPTDRQIITKQAISQEHTAYLKGVLEDTDDYFDLFETLRTSNEGDVVRIVIDCYGGSVSVGYVIIQHILEARQAGVDVIAVIGRNCASMATVVAMYCTDLELYPWSNMMIHSGSEAHYGAMNECKKSIQFSLQEGEKDLRRDYEHFLTPNEITHLIENSEPMLLDVDEIRTRWIRKATADSGEGDMPDFEEVVRKIVREEQEALAAPEKVTPPTKKKAPAKKKTSK